MTRRSTALVLLQVVASLACALASDSAGPAAPSPAQINRSFTLSPGASVRVETENLLIGFDRVVSDSRCPRGAQCIAAGEAVVRIWLSKAPAARDSRELKTTPNATDVVYGAYRITLVALDPQPTIDRTIRPSDYVVTLLVTRT